MISTKSVVKNAATYGFYVAVILSKINLSYGYCPGGWIQHGQKCYGAFMPLHDIDSVESMDSTFCRMNGGILLQPKTAEENRAAQNLLHSRFPLTGIVAIIGLNDRDTEGTFRWGDGTKLSDTWQNWMRDEPNDAYDDEDCVLLYGNGEWNDVSCRAYFINSYMTLCEQPIKDTCPTGWTKHGQKCYKAFPATGHKETIMEKEKVFCISNNGVLMNTKTEEENLLALNLINSLPPTYLARGIIGLNDRESEGRYLWSDGTKLTWQNWQNWLSGQPDNQEEGKWWELKKGEDCVQLSQDGKWADIPCNGDFLYNYVTLCERLISVTGYCPGVWWKYGEKCYAGFPQLDGLHDVEDMEEKYCVANEGTLMNPKTEEENRLAVSLMDHVLANSSYLGIIGLSDTETEGTFKWMDGTSLSANWQNWERGQPDNRWQFLQFGAEDCVEMNTNGRWNDWACDKVYGHIALCEKPAKEAPETTMASMETVTASMSTSPDIRAEKEPTPSHRRKPGPYQRKRVFTQVATLGENPYSLSEPSAVLTAVSMTICFVKCMEKEDCAAINFSAKHSECRLFNSAVTEVKNEPDWSLFMPADV